MKATYTEQAPEAIGPYSQGIIVNDLFYSSGQIPLTPDGDMIDGGIVEQTHQVFSNIKAVLASAGASLDTVVKVNVYVRNIADFPTINDIYGTYFANHQPARSLVEVSNLPKGALIEMEVVALTK